MAWELAHRGLRPRRRPPLGHGPRRPTTRPSRSGSTRSALPARAHPAHGRRGQLLGHGRDRPVRARLGDLLRQGPGLRPRRRPQARRRRALRRVLEPRLHAVQPRRRRHARASCPARTSTPARASSGSCRILQGHDSIFDTDLFVPIIDAAASVIGHRATAATRRPTSRCASLADHGRAMTMLVADGVLPANEGRGYVLRRVVRRAVLAARRLGVRASPIDARRWSRRPPRCSGEAYPTLRARARPHRQRSLEREEAGFDRTLRAGLGPLGGGASPTGAQGARRATWPSRLHDTHGFPVELTEELAARRRGRGRPGRLRRRHGRAARAGAGRGASRPRAGDEAAYRVPARRRGPDAVRRPRRRSTTR